MPNEGDWSADRSPERLQHPKSFDIIQPRLSRVQLPTYKHLMAPHARFPFVLTISDVAGTFVRMTLNAARTILNGHNGTSKFQDATEIYF
jgi:hypothetical protein